MKKSYFIFLNLFIIGLIIFVISFYLSVNILLSLFLVILSLGVYYLLTNTLFDEIFDIEEKLKKNIKTTLHELNTPVATIQLNTNILKSKLKDEINLKRLTRIESSSNEILKLYEDMEYFIKKNIASIDKEEFFINEIIKKSIKKFKDIKKDVKINSSIPDIMIKADKKGIETIFDNLISNAIRHNKYIKNIDIFYKDNLIYVKDDGEGMDSTTVCNIFNKYFQDHKAKNFGLGLAIVKEICDNNDIDIKIESSNKGTTFKLGLSKIKVVL